MLVKLFVYDKSYNTEDGYTLICNQDEIGIAVETAVKNGFKDIRISDLKPEERYLYLKEKIKKMKYNLYAVQDVIIGFGIPFVKCNDQHAIRDYCTDLKTNPHAADMRLFRVGEFNDETGEIEPCLPVCLQGGGVNDSSEN